MASANFHIKEVTGRVTIRVRGLGGFKVRLKIARWLFILGARVAGVGIVIEE